MDLLIAPQHTAPADRHPMAVYLARLAPGSRRTMHQALDAIAAVLTGGQATGASLSWPEVRYQHAQAVRAELLERHAPATVNKMLAALRGVVREAFRLGLMSAEDYSRVMEVESVKGETLPRGRALASGEIGALLAGCARDPRPAGARDAAVLALLYGAGLRRSELVALDVSDFDPTTGALAIRQSKGRKDRLVYATNGSALALEDWLAVRGGEPGPLFVAVTKGGHLVGTRLTGQAVLYILQRRSQAAAVAKASPHDLRRTFISDLLSAGADISTVQRLAGHSQVQTTARYDRRGESEKRRPAELLHVPYTGRVKES